MDFKKNARSALENALISDQRKIILALPSSPLPPPPPRQKSNGLPLIVYSKNGDQLSPCKPRKK